MITWEAGQNTSQSVYYTPPAIDTGFRFGCKFNVEAEDCEVQYSVVAYSDTSISFCHTNNYKLREISRHSTRV